MTSTSKCTKRRNLHFFNFKIWKRKLKNLKYPSGWLEKSNQYCRIVKTSWDYPFKESNFKQAVVFSTDFIGIVVDVSWTNFMSNILYSKGRSKRRSRWNRSRVALLIRLRVKLKIDVALRLSNNWNILYRIIYCILYCIKYMSCYFACNFRAISHFFK
jgi:hypothetical protein